MNNYSLKKNIVIENNNVKLNDEVIFNSNEETFAAFAKSVYKSLDINYGKFYKMSHLCKLGFIASELLLKNVEYSELKPEEIALVIANSSSSLHADTEYQSSIETVPSPSVFVYTLPNIVIGEICIRNNFKGEGTFFVQEKYNQDFIQKYAENLINNQSIKMCIFGWLEMDCNENYLANLNLIKR